MWEVKPCDSETNLDDLNTKIKAEITMDGLNWNQDYKKEPVAFGIFKLIVGACVEDEKVSTDDIEEKIMAMDEFVQSIEIASFNKL
jgi:translation elongation factor EF-1beta